MAMAMVMVVAHKQLNYKRAKFPIGYLQYGMELMILSCFANAAANKHQPDKKKLPRAPALSLSLTHTHTLTPTLFYAVLLCSAIEFPDSYLQLYYATRS